MMAGGATTQPYARGKDLGERSGDDGLLRKVLPERWQRFPGKIQFAIGIVLDQQCVFSTEQFCDILSPLLRVRDP